MRKTEKQHFKTLSKEEESPVPSYLHGVLISYIIMKLL